MGTCYICRVGRLVQGFRAREAFLLDQLRAQLALARDERTHRMRYPTRWAPRFKTSSKRLPPTRQRDMCKSPFLLPALLLNSYHILFHGCGFRLQQLCLAGCLVWIFFVFRMRGPVECSASFNEMVFNAVGAKQRPLIVVGPFNEVEVAKQILEKPPGHTRLCFGLRFTLSEAPCPPFECCQQWVSLERLPSFSLSQINSGAPLRISSHQQQVYLT